jgi:glycosyltransferase involved in cell wall biosynthesis
MTESLVTVLIPSHNRPAFLAEALASVLVQDYEHFVVLVADDASNYDVASLVASFNDARITLHRQQRNLGAVQNWRWALGAPTTRYLALLEDDCLWLPHHLGEAIKALEEHPEAPFYCCATEVFGGGSSGVLKPHWSTATTLELSDWRGTGFGVWLQGSPPMCCSSIVLRRAALADLFWGGRTWPWCHDYLWWGQLALKGPFIYEPAIGARYRWHDSNITHANLLQHWKKMPEWRFTVRTLAARAYALGGLRDLAAETQGFRPGVLSAVVVSLAAMDSPRALARQARAIFEARRALARDPECSIHYRVAARVGGSYLTYADLVSRLVARWWPHPAL